MAERISTLDTGYQTGDLSIFPEVIDDKESLYEVRNNAEAILKAGLSFNGKYVIVDDATKFPPKGIIRIGPPAGTAGSSELIYYGLKANNVFKELVRGFTGSRQNQWPAGSHVTNAVTAETHNAIKDAIWNIQHFVGLRDNPDVDSLNGMIKGLEVRHLAPKAQFRAFPRKGPPSLKVRFQNFSSGDVIRFLWDFGDGASSIEKNPSHTYTQEGTYSVKLNVITSTGSQGIATKSNYITVSEEERIPFFYVAQKNSTEPPYSTETAATKVLNGDPSAVAAEWLFVDQTDGDIVQRYWVFDDGETLAVNDPVNHTATHVYSTPGEYEPSLLVLFSNEKLKRVFLQQAIVVT